ncbi:7-methyl-GTP pyrophosphatase-like isoform X2 [Salvia hispanica]|uniref:7-methyl-GTP pyrophosphatase-like isoform X2 n=1 Tax=Salvia hispanica TaxID=49212 RepID=UPI002008FD53|nr:7-methyl-GTP pyrophosphatase-like isoform X2 [Salvia hispanica]
MDIRIPPKNQNFEIILGSSSKARREILAEMGYDFTILSADIDEKSIRKEKPEDLVMALAEAKADAIMMKLDRTAQVEDISRPTLLITADTGHDCNGIAMVRTSYLKLSLYLHLIGIKVVVYQGTIREKPTSAEEARQFIRDYSGGSGEVVGSVVVTNLVTGSRKGGWESAEVYFLEIPDEVIDSLIEEGITFNVAGGLMLEHPLILPLVDTVVGTADCVMGLSKTLTEKLMQEALVETMV